MDPVDAILLYVVLLISLVVHEASHALFALLGGDRTAYVGGQVTLNPIPHIRREPFGTVVLPLLILFASGGRMIFGYAHTPIDAHWAYQHPKRAALMSLAGPLSNALLVVIAYGILYALVASGVASATRFPAGKELLQLAAAADGGSEVTAVCRILSTFVVLNIVLGFFNLLPWPPLDGAGILEGLFPKRLRPFYGFIRSNPMLLLIGMVVIYMSDIILAVLYPAWRTLYHWL